MQTIKQMNHYLMSSVSVSKRNRSWWQSATAGKVQEIIWLGYRHIQVQNLLDDLLLRQIQIYCRLIFPNVTVKTLWCWWFCNITLETAASLNGPFSGVGMDLENMQFFTVRTKLPSTSSIGNASAKIKENI